jgi:glycine cleavage system H lipoate-binding protein
MTALLVITAFVAFIAIDYFIGLPVVMENAADEPVPARALRPAPFAFEPAWVGGYLMPEGFHYHRGHTWARQIDPLHFVVGVDDFAGRLLGDVSRVELPKRGERLRQGAVGARAGINGRTAELVAPVNGEVVELNVGLADHPELIRDDPYGRGWLMKVRTSDVETNVHNLMEGRLAQRWIADAGEQLELQLMALSGSVLQDGGRPAADFARHLDQEDWERLVGEFLLT